MARRCGRCIARPPAFDRYQGALVYAPPVSDLVMRFKFGKERSVTRALAACLAQHLKAIWREPTVHQHRQADPAADIRLPDLLVPIPLHQRRFRQRGFNQALEIAQWLGADLGIAVEERLIVRCVETRPQSELSANERLRNVRNAFQLSAFGEDWKSHSPAATVAIVDDVLTTGATAHAVSRRLKLAGVQTVLVWTPVRAYIMHPGWRRPGRSTR
ncbi:MAG: ComF family protein [Gammaproteobacteria bacterium]|nr:ComF family protein [Gammaproteobacteria bacterium]